MFDTRNDLPPGVRTKAVKLLNERAGIEAAARLGDADTSDLFTGLSREADKYLWFLEAHLHGRG